MQRTETAFLIARTYDLLYTRRIWGHLSDSFHEEPLSNWVREQAPRIFLNAHTGLLDPKKLKMSSTMDRFLKYSTKEKMVHGKNNMTVDGNRSTTTQQQKWKEEENIWPSRKCWKRSKSSSKHWYVFSWMLPYDGTWIKLKMVSKQGRDSKYQERH